MGQEGLEGLSEKSKILLEKSKKSLKLEKIPETEGQPVFDLLLLQMMQQDA